MTKKVMVSGCFDMLHSGHLAFFKEAATYGDLYVALGSDKTVYELKGRVPINTEDERLYMIQGMKSVTGAFVSQGSGMLDFKQEFVTLKPDILIVNEDGNTPAKQKLCEEYGVEYVVLAREPHEDLPRRSTTALRRIDQMPYRIDLAGGWLDQPFVSQHYPGSVITISLEATSDFNERSGMATSTRHKALDLWGSRLPTGNFEKLAKILFCYDNPPGTQQISGSQDAIGLVFPGLAKADYAGQYWPEKIERIAGEEAALFVQNALYLIPLDPRPYTYNPLDNTNITREHAKALALATDDCWAAIQTRDLPALGDSVRRSFEAQIAMFPHMVDDGIFALIDQYRDRTLGWKLSGAGGGGYLILVTDQPIKNAVRVVARTNGN